jgi:hypothetical protein
MKMGILIFWGYQINNRPLVIVSATTRWLGAIFHWTILVPGKKY